MVASRGCLPSSERLARGLSEALAGEGRAVAVVGREPVLRESTHPMEVVTCRLRDGATRRVLCKYSAGAQHSAFGHRGGVAYEAEVYRRLLTPWGVGAPALLGRHEDPDTGFTWLLLEYLEDAVPVSRVEDGPLRAAAWLGDFHRRGDAALRAQGSLPVLRRHDPEYYLGWARRTAEAAREAGAPPPWLCALCARFGAIAETLLEPPLTAIHGEFYPLNVLVSGRRVCPVDWESAALAAGAIDFASLAEGWSEEETALWARAYARARWSLERPPETFERRRRAAVIYWALRWLGNNPRKLPRRLQRRGGRLRSAGEQWGLI